MQVSIPNQFHCVKNIFKILVTGLVVCGMSLSASAQQTINFGSAFVVPEQSGANKVRLGGIAVNGFNSIFSVDWTIQPDYSLKLTNGDALNTVQSLLEQSLRNTKWIGTYSVNGYQYSTTLDISAVQNGYVGAEISHSGGVNGSSLIARLGGEIIKQYLINGVRYDEDFMSSAQLSSVGNASPVGYLVRIKRTRALTYIDSTSGWSTNREYRLTLNENQLSGTVVIPADVFGTSTDNSSLGTITLSKQ
ncbi:MAG: hypothetical protein RLZZ612_1156 [Pseudomonadota bacterium]|jgi:hypothetical protein